jgi:ubiquinone/menaquinone biosynthesis C-methylase UbiE
MNANQLLEPVKSIVESPKLDIHAVKARQKAMWESGDFGQVARTIEPVAAEFMSYLELLPGSSVLDAACGTGNLAVIAARRGCRVCGLDIAANLIAQARERARQESLQIEFAEGDAEGMPFADASFDAVVSMYGVMFAPRPAQVVNELRRVTKPGGFIAMANWTPEGFIGKMFDVFKAHLPPPPPGIPSTMLWGDEATVRDRLKSFTNVKLTRRIAVMSYPFPPAETVEFFRRYYGPTGRAFESLGSQAQEALRHSLVELQSAHNVSPTPETTEVHAEYLEIVAVRPRAA